MRVITVLGYIVRDIMKIYLRGINTENKMTIAQLREVIKRKGLKVKNVTKLKKNLVALIENSHV